MIKQNTCCRFPSNCGFAGCPTTGF